MDNLTASRIAGGNTAYKRVASDFYPTPPEATVALMDFLDLPKGTKNLGASLWSGPHGQGNGANGIRCNRGRTSSLEMIS